MNIEFLETELTSEGKRININVDGVMCRVELYRPDKSTGHSGWGVVDTGMDDGIGSTIETDLTLTQAKNKAMEYLALLEQEGESVYFADSDNENAEADNEKVDPDNEKVVDEHGQRILFPDISDYTDPQYEEAKKAHEHASSEFNAASREKKRATEIAKMKEMELHARAVALQSEETRVASLCAPDRAFVCINARGKLKTVGASEIHTYPLSEICIHQAFHNGFPCDLEDAKEIDFAFVEAGKLKPKDYEGDEGDAVESEYRCARFDSIESVMAVNFGDAREKMQCSPEDEHSGCFGCAGPVRITSKSADEVDEMEADDLPPLPDTSEGIPFNPDEEKGAA